MCVTEKTSTLLARVPRRVTVTWPQGIRWPQFLKLQFYSPHPPLKEENVGRGVEKEEDEEKPVTSSSLNICLCVLGKLPNYSPHPPLFPSFLLLSPLSPLLFIS